jgi:hypothetical protein
MMNNTDTVLFQLWRHFELKKRRPGPMPGRGRMVLVAKSGKKKLICNSELRRRRPEQVYNQLFQAWSAQLIGEPLYIRNQQALLAGGPRQISGSVEEVSFEAVLAE